MLQIKQICKQYKTGNYVQKALDHVSLNLRENEFVAILGPSGSGKTTLLNIIGGLDRYDSGDLIINGISTRKYKDRDWDSYRNHTIGFVFQSYNLIPHQTILANVELALTISGISRAERQKRAKNALIQVGLGEQLHKKPNQMSGGQMQRVAIARALVNDPEILLADEPTGALDSDTSIQVMELLKEVAKERLVVMVTHNPELAREYATRIVNLKDGVIRSDSMPCEIDESSLEPPKHKNMGKSSMSFFTALSLSFHNLRTKKARTLLTSFAGSIGIIGIALILSLSNGVNAYIQSVEEDTLSEYPLEITSTGVDFASMMVHGGPGGESENENEVGVAEFVTSMFSRMDSNDLESLKSFFDSGESRIDQYVKSIEYTYNVSPQIFRTDGDGVRRVNPDSSFSALGFGSGESSNSMMSMTMNTDVFYEMPGNPDLYEGQYEVKAGRWPEDYNECVLVLTSSGDISDLMMYALGLRDAEELDEMVRQFAADKPVEVPDETGSYSYSDILGVSFRLVNSADYYEYDDEYGVWVDQSDDDAYMKNLVKNGEELNIVGIVQPAEDAGVTMLNTGIGYTPKLTAHIIEQASESQIVQEQLKKKTINVFTGEPFGEQSEEERFDVSTIFQVDTDALAKAFQVDESMFSVDLSSLSGLSIDSSALAGAFPMEDGQFDLSALFDLDDLTEDLSKKLKKEIRAMTKELDLSVSDDELQVIARDMMKGFQDSLPDGTSFDITDPSSDFLAYLSTDDAKQRLSDSVERLLSESVQVSVSYSQLLGMVQTLFTGYQEYAASNKIEETTAVTILAYLQTPQVQQMITSEAEQIIRGSLSFQITPEQIQETIIKDLAAGYQEYAAASSSSSDSSSVIQAYLDYMTSAEGQERLYQNLAACMDLEEAAGILTTVLQELGTELGTELEKQLTAKTDSAMQAVAGQIGSGIASALSQALGQIGSNMENAIHIDEEAFMEAIQVNMTQDELTTLLTSLMSDEDAAYENNLRKLGYAELSQPGSVSIYPLDFEGKEQVLHILDHYNQQMEENGEEDKKITYTDLVGTLMSSVTDIVDMISYVLVAFVAISLVVSSIMIGVITYISVLERKKEIGILRAIGASRRNISQVFNAETFIIGLCAGVIGIVLTLLLLIPGNAIIHSLSASTDINAVLPAVPAAALIILSVLLTILGGLIPSKKAAKSDPVAALRSE